MFFFSSHIFAECVSYLCLHLSQTSLNIDQCTISLTLSLSHLRFLLLLYCSHYIQIYVVPHIHNDKFMDSPVQSRKGAQRRGSSSVKESCVERKRRGHYYWVWFLTVTRFTYDFILNYLVISNNVTTTWKCKPDQRAEITTSCSSKRDH